MGTSTAVIGAAALAVVILGLGAGLVIGARRRDRQTKDALLRLGDSMAALSTGIDSVVERASPTSAFASPVGVTLDLQELLLRIAARVASLPGVDAGAVQATHRRGLIEHRAVGLTSGSTGLESVFDPPDRRSWEAVELTWWPTPDATANGEPVRSALVAPIRYEDRRIGTVAAYARDAGGLSDRATADFITLASELGPPLQAALEHAETVELVVTDGLTGLLNRRGYDEALARECALAARTGRPLCLLMLDLDDFHGINAAHGYPVGDAVLHGFADAMRTVSRTTDVLCRRGGEELVMLLPDTPCAGAIDVDRRLRAVVAATAFPGAGTITYSSGIAAWEPSPPGVGPQPFPAPSPEELDALASASVLRAKAQGKNRLADEPGGGQE